MLQALAGMTLVVALMAPFATGCSVEDVADVQQHGTCEDPSSKKPAGTLAFATPCCSDEECSTGTCALFNQRGHVCSKACKTDDDCKGLGKNHCGDHGACAVGGAH